MEAKQKMTGRGRNKTFVNKSRGPGKVQFKFFSDMSLLPRDFAISFHFKRETDRNTNFHDILITTFILDLLPMFVILIWLAQCMFIYKHI